MQVTEKQAARKLVIFDLDGTLADTLPDIAAALNFVAEAEGITPFRYSEVRQMLGSGLDVLLRRAMALRGFAVTPAVREALIEAYRAHLTDESRLFPGISEVLQCLADQGYVLAVCSNKRHDLVTRLTEFFGISHFFSQICGYDGLTPKKPDPAPLLKISEACGILPENGVMIGDHKNDTEAAANAGMKALYASWGYGKAEECAAPFLSSPAEILSFVQKEDFFIKSPK